MQILVTGGLGFIGSHTVVELIKKGYQPVIIDNLSNSNIEVLQRIKNIVGVVNIPFEQIDLKDKNAVSNFFKTYTDIKGVIHFAASKAVGESVQNPLMYYDNNLTSLIYILQNITSNKNMKFIFSSSCTVYGQAEKMPITENAPRQKATSPYGNTKTIAEDIINETAMVTDLQAILLRYFNPIGAHPSAEIGELPLGVPQNLVPFITQTAIGIREELSVFGNDYPTPDGTCVRDYIHVMDLAEAHVVALERLLDEKVSQKVEIFNVGTGKGTSVLEIIQTFEKITGQKLNYKYAPRREGDTAIAYADTTKVNETLGWKATRTLEEALSSAWNWQENQKQHTL